MATAFFLTPAETRLIESLLAGRSLRETTAALGVAMTTAKTPSRKKPNRTRLSLIDRGLRRASLTLGGARACALWCARSERPGGLND